MYIRLYVCPSHNYCLSIYIAGGQVANVCQQVHSKNLWVAQPSPEGWEADSCFQLGICFHLLCRGACIHWDVVYVMAFKSMMRLQHTVLQGSRLSGSTAAKLHFYDMSVLIKHDSKM